METFGVVPGTSEALKTELLVLFPEDLRATCHLVNWPGVTAG